METYIVSSSSFWAASSSSTVEIGPHLTYTAFRNHHLSTEYNSHHFFRNKRSNFVDSVDVALPPRSNPGRRLCQKIPVQRL